jgi:outer membrane protein TolC
LNESPALEASRLDVAAATEEARAAHGEALPHINATAGYELFGGSPTAKFGIVNAGSSVVVGTNSDNSVSSAGVQIYSANLSYPLFRDGSILGLNTGPNEASKLARKRNLSWTSKMRREEVIARIAEAYVTTVSAVNRAGYAERRVELLQKQVDITQEQQKQGLMLPIDLKLARTQLSGAQTLAKILRQQAISGRIELARALGFESPNELHLSNELPEPPEPPSADKIISSAVLAEHPSLEIQKAVIDEARQDYRLERFRLYPSVTLTGSAVHVDDFGSSGAEIYTGAVRFDVPLFDFGTQMSTTRAKLAKYQAERARLSSVGDDVTFQIVKIFQAIYVVSKDILSLQEDVAKADRDLQVIGSQQQAGISPPLTAIEKELHLIAKRDDLDGLEVRRLVLYAALEKAAGGSWKWIQ